MTDRATEETGWHVLREHIRDTTGRRWFEPVREPMSVTETALWAVATLAAIVAFVFWWSATP